MLSETMMSVLRGGVMVDGGASRVGGAFGARLVLSLVSGWAGGSAPAAGYGVALVVSCCMACRALVVAASGVRAPTWQGRKWGPASSSRGRRGAPYRRGCMSSRLMGSWVAVLVMRRHRWSSVWRRCLPRHAAHAPGGRRLVRSWVVGSHCSRSSQWATPSRANALQIRETLAGACPSWISRAPISLCEGYLVPWSFAVWAW